MTERFHLIFTQHRLLYVAAMVALLGVVLAPSSALRWTCLVAATITVLVAVMQHRARPILCIDGTGYTVERQGREKLRVAWSEVTRVRADPKEHAAYVDCGDPARNLLVPPRRGFAFRFERSAELYQRIVTAVPDRVEVVERLMADTPPKTKA